MPNTTWIVVANASTARIYAKAKGNHHLDLIKEFSHPESRKKVVDLISDNLGRFNAGHAGNLGGGNFCHTDPKRVEADRFAQELSEFLEQARCANEFRSLILAMPAHFQSMLKYHSNRRLLDKIKRVIPKDYHAASSEKLREMFA